VPPSRLDPSVVREAKALIDGGMSQRQAAVAVGISQAGLSGALRRSHDDDIDPIGHDATEDFVEIPVIHRDYSDMDTLYVYPLGDVHIGAPAHDRARWEEWLDYLTGREDASMIGTGDFLNSAIVGSVSDVYEETAPVGECKRLLRRQLQPLKDRIDLLIRGNHENRINKAVGDCPIHDVADFLEVPYAPNVALVVYRVGDVEYHVYVRHGTGGGQVGARANRLAKQAETCLADVYISGHTHSKLAFPTEIFRYDPEARKVRRTDRWFVSSGSFLRMEPYAAAAGYSPTRIGAHRIRIDGRHRDISVSI
jgi:predicted phosphodiesterase